MFCLSYFGRRVRVYRTAERDGLHRQGKYRGGVFEIEAILFLILPRVGSKILRAENFFGPYIELDMKWPPN